MPLKKYLFFIFFLLPFFIYPSTLPDIRYLISLCNEYDIDTACEYIEKHWPHIITRENVDRMVSEAESVRSLKNTVSSFKKIMYLGIWSQTGLYLYDKYTQANRDLMVTLIVANVIVLGISGITVFIASGNLLALKNSYDNIDLPSIAKKILDGYYILTLKKCASEHEIRELKYYYLRALYKIYGKDNYALYPDESITHYFERMGKYFPTQ